MMMLMESQSKWSWKRSSIIKVYSRSMGLVRESKERLSFAKDLEEGGSVLLKN